MKNVVIIDGALNSRFEIYGIEENIFNQLFPSDIDEIYLEDLDDELQDDATFWNRVYENEIGRQNVQGIHGILHTHPRSKVSMLEPSS